MPMNISGNISGKISRPVILLMLALAPCGLTLAPSGLAQAQDMANACRLKGGSLVPLPAEACVKEGGTPVTGAAAATGMSGAAAAAASAVSGPAATYQLSADPRLAAAQKALLDVLNKPVVDKSRRKDPEGLERAGKFAECSLTVEESLHVDYGNLLSDRKDFRIVSTIDFRNIRREEFGVLGEVVSKGGDLKADAVYLEQPKHAGNNISISVSVLKGGDYRKVALPGPVAYWGAPREDLWMVDEYGYVGVDRWGHAATDKVRILFIVNSDADAQTLKKTLDDMQAACRPQQ